MIECSLSICFIIFPFTNISSTISPNLFAMSLSNITNLININLYYPFPIIYSPIFKLIFLFSSLYLLLHKYKYLLMFSHQIFYHHQPISELKQMLLKNIFKIMAFLWLESLVTPDSLHRSHNQFEELFGLTYLKLKVRHHLSH